MRLGDIMKADERRKAILNAISESKNAVSGGELSKQLQASRQIIVQDIAVLRAAGYDIMSTHEGYVLKSTPLKERIFKLRHTGEQTEDELTTIVALGGTVVDVFVWHKVYGKVEATMNIFSNRSIEQFLSGIKSGKSTELMNITAGYHYHTVRAESEAVLDKIEQALTEKGYIVPEI